MSKMRGSNAFFQLLPDTILIGNKVFEGDDREAKCDAEFRGMRLIVERVPRRVLPPMETKRRYPMKIAMTAYGATLEDAIAGHTLSTSDLQYVIFHITDLLMDMARRQILHMDIHAGNILLKFCNGKLFDVVIIDTTFTHDFSDGVLPTHCRSCAFDPRYDLAFFSYSILGLCKIHGVPFPVMPLSQSELSEYDKYITEPHEWRLAVGCYAYYPKHLTAFQKYHHRRE